MKVVRQVLGRQFSFGGEEHSGWLPPGAAWPLPTPVKTVVLDVRILDFSDVGDKGYILEWQARDSALTGDTWHETVENAERQAEEFFGIHAGDWNLPPKLASEK